MNEQELAEITRLIGVENPPSSKEVLSDIVSGWIARTVKKEGRAQEEVERCVLEWTARSWKILIPEGTDTNDLERALRLKIAKDAAEFLSPGWAICCALIAVGKQDNILDKLDLMEQAVAVAVPSQKARRAKREEWGELCSRWSKTSPENELDSYLNALKERPELQAEALTLGLALSLLDGSIGFTTERLYRDICDRLDMARGDSDEIKQKVNDLYWKHHNAAVPTEVRKEQESDPVRSATRRTVYDAGALEALAAEARAQLFAKIEPKKPKKSGWSKLVGGLSGMSPFFSSKMKNDAHATLARVVYHTILKQHDAVVARARVAHAGLQGFLQAEEPKVEMVRESGEQKVPPAAQSPTPTPEEPTQAPSAEAEPVAGTPSLSEQMVDTAEKPKRVIKLDF